MRKAFSKAVLAVALTIGIGSAGTATAQKPGVNDRGPAASRTPSEFKIGTRMRDGSVFAGVSRDKVLLMYTTRHDAPGTYTWTEAMKYCSDLGAEGHRIWRLPTEPELFTLFNNSAAIGYFHTSGSDPATWYWSSSRDSTWGAWGQRFSDDAAGYPDEFDRLSVRCVR